MKKEKLVSIIIPTYNTDYSLKRAIDSVINQTYKNIEIIVVDDNNLNSKYRKIAESIMKNYECISNIKYIKHDKNRNGSAARNTGLKHSKGEYICFLDDDDYFYPNKIEKQYRCILASNADGCVCFYEKDNHINTFKVKNNYIKEILMCENCPQTSSFMLKNEAVIKIDGFDESYQRHQDYEFMLRFCQKYTLCVCQDVLYTMDRNASNNIPDGYKLEKIKNKFLQQFDYLIDQYNLNKNKVYAKHYASVAYAYLKSNNLKDFIRIFKEYPNIWFINELFHKIFNFIRYRMIKIIKKV